jgi:hypothetical protein
VGEGWCSQAVMVRGLLLVTVMTVRICVSVSVSGVLEEW